MIASLTFFSFSTFQTWYSWAVSTLWECLDTYPDQDIFVSAMIRIINICYKAIAEMAVSGTMEDTVLKIVKSLDRLLAVGRLSCGGHIEWIGSDGATRLV